MCVDTDGDVFTLKVRVHSLTPDRFMSLCTSFFVFYDVLYVYYFMCKVSNGNVVGVITVFFDSDVEHLS